MSVELVNNYIKRITLHKKITVCTKKKKKNIMAYSLHYIIKKKNKNRHKIINPNTKRLISNLIQSKLLRQK